ncbi:hypothetical protein [Bacillus haynesii]|uniref:hypothetical protein n=1 Tax=Bacillus haynesii TaxID=1925021 RepID=UPI00228246B4|nr:hypothetical protein [Bacillus haynesii]MCY8755661.1 hypothetical protein [Bacillus haynesii]
MNPREAFRVFIRFQIENGERFEHLGLSNEDIEKFIFGVEDDQNFYDKLDDFLKEYIEDFGENYGIES